MKFFLAHNESIFSVDPPGLSSELKRLPTIPKREYPDAYRCIITLYSR